LQDKPRPQFQGLPRAVLVAISRATGESYEDINGRELIDELARMGHHPESTHLYNLMFRLRDDGGYVSFRAAMGQTAESLHFIRLAEAGRQEVEGWPRASGVWKAASLRLV
jgi:DNA-binding PadR family transcriptional regulator